MEELVPEWGWQREKWSWFQRQCEDLMVLALASQRKGNNAPSTWSLVVDKERMQPGHR